MSGRVGRVVESKVSFVALVGGAFIMQLRRVGTLSTRLGRRSKSTALSVEVNKQGVAVLRLDCPGEVQNTLSMELIQEFDEVCTRTHAACECSRA